MVNLHVSYQGELRCSATHGPSGKQLTTDAPVDNHGRGETFSPTDLVGTALGSCLLTVMGIAARAKQIDLEGTHVSVVKEMTSQLPRRIARLTTVVTFPARVSAAIGDTDRRQLETIAENCPVRLSLSSGVEVPIDFNWE
jgi:putative redox protein